MQTVKCHETMSYKKKMTSQVAKGGGDRLIPYNTVAV